MCCGLGGATHGLTQAGIHVTAAYDLWPVAVEQHQIWHPDVPCAVRDISTITTEELAGHLVWASLPCQPYSVANQRNRGVNHPHYYSLRTFARQVQHATCTVIENVAGLAWMKEGQDELHELADECRTLGLHMFVQVVRCDDHGLPFPGKRAIVTIARDVNDAARVLMPTTARVPMTSPRPLASDNKGGKDTGRAPQRSMEDAAALQGVCVPQGVSRTTATRLIGNAVPPRLARAIAEQLLLPAARL